MKKWLNTTAVLLSLLWVWAIPPAGAQGSPKAFVANSTYAFSNILEGDEVTHEFIIENRGDAPLNITKVKTA